METVAKNTKPFWTELLDTLNQDLEIIEKTGDSRIAKAQTALQTCKEVLAKLEEGLEGYKFTDPQPEIFFFKEVKPKFLSRLIYYHRLYAIEVSLPVGNQKDQEDYLQKELDRIKEFFDDNKFFYQYFRSGESYLDEKLFLRQNEHDALSLPIFELYANPAFTTQFDYILSRILANEMLWDYLQKALAARKNEQSPESKSSLATTLTWTEAKSALIELIYAFKARGSFNHGKATLKEITDLLQVAFNVQITNPSRDFQDILSRKRSHTIYLDGLKESYLKYIDAIDERK